MNPFTLIAIITVLAGVGVCLLIRKGMRDAKKLEDDRFRLYPFKYATKEQKEHLIKDFSELTAKHALQLYMSLGLQSHFECMIINDATGEEYILSFKKIN